MKKYTRIVFFGLDLTKLPIQDGRDDLHHIWVQIL